MPSGSATTKPIESPTNLQPKNKSISQMVKGAGFKDLTHMMYSSGLKRHDEADVQEAKAILNAWKQADQKDCEASQRK
ncbi:hypothetical protein SBOR_10164 [Sclerotinia borealis F-4128]|uniref:Uncharacterized protein n=1 Tax=Sclerotinia borealis (strain F-4128) TaxID=1432307 RepID=W9C179_SCLBF|nr:hypothetical protein SBOR_10164 [Sclerotinia borealis F-4128]